MLFNTYLHNTAQPLGCGCAVFMYGAQKTAFTARGVPSTIADTITTPRARTAQFSPDAEATAAPRVLYTVMDVAPGTRMPSAVRSTTSGRDVALVTFSTPEFHCE